MEEAKNLRLLAKLALASYGIYSGMNGSPFWGFTVFSFALFYV